VAHFEQHGLQLLQQASRRFPIWVMHGNRDFLLGNRAARLGGFDFMADPCVLTFGGARWLLTHGDALCLEDSAYQSFRQLVRSPQWQHDFLALPLSERKQQVRQMRAQSRLHQARLKQQQQAGSAGLSDVSTPLALQWMNDLSTPVMIHGHTHQPADHAMGLNRQRMVLSDWDGKATPFRAELIRLELQNTAPFGVQVSRVRCAPLA
jgi:UDP-2,3-diacylglucosamine hydrolase